MTDPLADKMYEVYQKGDWKPYGPWNLLARAARDYFINDLKSEIEDINIYGDGGRPPTRFGLERAIKIIDFDRGLE
jgi:hypothetical protein